MSYDISLWVKSFLERALASGLGDWTGADPIPTEAVDAVVEAAVAEGFKPVAPDPALSDFLREQGVEASRGFVLDDARVLAELSIHRGEIAFTIPYGQRTDASIALCTRVAKRIAAAHGLAFWDPQTDDGEGGAPT